MAPRWATHDTRRMIVSISSDQSECCKQVERTYPVTRRPLAGADGTRDHRDSPPLKHDISRRAILGSLAGIAGAAALTACGGDAVAVTTTNAVASPATSASQASVSVGASSSPSASGSASTSVGSSTSVGTGSNTSATPSSTSKATNGAPAVTLTWLAGRSAQEAPI